MNPLSSFWSDDCATEEFVMNQSINHKFVFVWSIDCNSYRIINIYTLIAITHYFTDYFPTRLFAGNLNWHFCQLITFLVVTDLSNICMNTKTKPISRKSRRNQTYTTTGQISRDVSHHHCMQPRQVGGEGFTTAFQRIAQSSWEGHC